MSVVDEAFSYWFMCDLKIPAEPAEPAERASEAVKHRSTCFTGTEVLPLLPLKYLPAEPAEPAERASEAVTKPSG
jgi:hypothetical protein